MTAKKAFNEWRKANQQIELDYRAAGWAETAWHAALDYAAETLVAVPIPFQSQEQFDGAMAHARRILAAIRPPKDGG